VEKINIEGVDFISAPVLNIYKYIIYAERNMEND
jgi:hypothetical protein